MPQQVGSSVENNFTKGLITEFTGLNFPENAATETFNCEYDLVGQVKRRRGIDFDSDGHFEELGPRAGSAISVYKWKNAGGDGNTQVLVVQVGTVLNFYLATDATTSSPLSAQKLASTVDLSGYAPSGSTVNPYIENTYADGNGYLFVFNTTCEPIYCTYNDGVITATAITIRVRDFLGIPELDVPVTLRPTSLTNVHRYNISNQGWTTKSAWGSNTTPFTTQITTTGSKTFYVGTVSGITLGDTVYGYSNAVYSGIGGLLYGSGYVTFGGTVTAYSDPYLTVNITSANNFSGPSLSFGITQTNQGFVDAWHTSQGNYPSNADVWWYFKNNTGVFDPATQANVSLSAGNAPQGHYIFSAFNHDRGSVSGLSGLGTVSTATRPSNGAWFQGRVWYTGVNASKQTDEINPFYSWSENIYFSQVNVGTAVNFGNCFQVNDPTSENLFDLLPTDGGVITIQGSGRIDKLFPTQNGLLVFAANGVWFITGSQGIGFTANDYTVTRLSSVESLSPYSYVDVLGLPYFWNEEGIYAVQPQQGGGLSVEPITMTTILRFYNAIPKENKKYARGAYNPIDYTIQWVYRSDEGDSVRDRYTFDRILNYNNYNKAFYPYSIDSSNANINGIVYMQGPGGLDSPDPVFKYLASYGEDDFAFADERDEDYVDWATVEAINFDSYFITGYKLRGKAMTKFQSQYVQVYANTNDEAFAYKIQGIWDYANSGNSGRYSNVQMVTQALTRFNTVFRRHKIRGHGFSLQFKISSVDGMPFDIIGWAGVDTINQGT